MEFYFNANNFRVKKEVMFLLPDENFRGFHTLSTSANPVHLTFGISSLCERPQSQCSAIALAAILQNLFIAFFSKE